MKKVIATDDAPSAIGPYSQAIVMNGFLFVSGQIPINGETGEIEGDDIATQAERVISNLFAIIEASGASKTNIVKCTCFLDSMDDFAIFNEVYSKHFSGIAPARECVAVQTLPKNALVEISAICGI